MPVQRVTNAATSALRLLCFIRLGKQIHSMVAHLDAVTSLAVDPNGLYLLSGSKKQ